jgi:hypothetical protein
MRVNSGSVLFFTHSAAKGKTPYELFHGKRPNLSNLRVFVKSAIVYIPKPNRTKLDSKGTEAIFVGYSSAMKAWVFWDHNVGKVIVSSTATFGDEIFTMDTYTKPKFHAMVPGTHIPVYR